VRLARYLAIGTDVSGTLVQISSDKENFMPHVQLPNSTHTLPPGSIVERKTNPHQWLEVTLGVARKKQLPDLSALEMQKPRQRKYMTRAELEKDYGASQDAIDKIEEYAKEHNLQVTRVEPISARMRLAGSVEDVSAAFDVALYDYQNEKLGKFHGHTGPVSIPAELEGAVTGVFGFNNHRHLRRHQATKVTVLTPADQATAPTRAWFEPQEMAGFYNFPAATGSGECIALLEFGGGIEDDGLTTYFNKLNIPKPKVLTIPVDDVSTDPQSDPDSTGEVMLDIEMAGALAPDATIAVYFSTFDEKGLIDCISAVVSDKNNNPSLASISWGWDENQPFQNSILWTPAAIEHISASFLAAAHLGITVSASTGDAGSEAQIDDGRAHVNYPATDPNVLAVGGTTLHKKRVSSKPAIASEVVWNDGKQDATGGGISDSIPRPSWQSANVVPPSINPTHFQGRGIPDVSANADPATGYLTYSGGKFGIVGGTSASSPLWAALIARCNELLGARVGNFNALLYSTIGPANVLRDITKGNNDADGLLDGQYGAKVGWDACSGWGTPDGQKLLNALK
jgi:kumamolisin